MYLTYLLIPHSSHSTFFTGFKAWSFGGPLIFSAVLLTSTAIAFLEVAQLDGVLFMAPQVHRDGTFICMHRFGEYFGYYHGRMVALIVYKLNA
jgi:hypothetical protein